MNSLFGRAMKSIRLAITLLCLGSLTSFDVASADEIPSLDVMEVVSTATEAYIYGYPLVTFDMVRMQQTNVATRMPSMPHGADDQDANLSCG